MFSLSQTHIWPLELPEKQVRAFASPSEVVASHFIDEKPGFVFAAAQDGAGVVSAMELSFLYFYIHLSTAPIPPASVPPAC